MRVLAQGIFVIAAAGAARGAAAAAGTIDAATCNPQAAAEQIFALANQARAQAGVGRLDWDPALADAALQHCLRMAAEGPISHQYNGEPDLSDADGAGGRALQRD